MPQLRDLWASFPKTVVELSWRWIANAAASTSGSYAQEEDLATFQSLRKHIGRKMTYTPN